MVSVLDITIKLQSYWNSAADRPIKSGMPVEISELCTALEDYNIVEIRITDGTTTDVFKPKGDL